MSHSFPKRCFPSPLAGEGCGGLASDSELSRSWVGGPRREARSARALDDRESHDDRGTIAVIALLRARAALAVPPPIQLRLGSLRSPRLRILPPQGGKGFFS